MPIASKRIVGGWISDWAEMTTVMAILKRFTNTAVQNTQFPLRWLDFTI